MLETGSLVFNPVGNMNLENGWERQGRERCWTGKGEEVFRPNGETQLPYRPYRAYGAYMAYRLYRTVAAAMPSQA